MKRHEWLVIIAVFVVAYILGEKFPMTGRIKAAAGGAMGGINPGG